MITLTTPVSINSVLGGNVPVGYNKLVISPFTMNALNGTINAQLRLTSTTDVMAQPINGQLTISPSASEVIVEISQIDFFRRVATNAGQISAIVAIIESAQAQIENGLISLGVISGVRTTGF